MDSISLPEQIFRTRRFGLGAPGQFTIAPDGGTVLFRRSRAGDDPAGLLWALDLDTGTERLLADPAPAGAGIAGYATDEAVTLAAFTVAGELWVVDVASGAARRLATAGAAEEPRPDPAGRRVAYVSGGTLRVIEADGTGDRELAAPDGPEVAFGIVRGAGQDALHTGQGFWWAPDGARLLVARVDPTAVALWHYADPTDPAAPPVTKRYPAAGTANAEITLWVAGLDGTRVQVPWDRAAFEYVTAAGWDATGPYAAVQSRDQRTVLFLAIDPGSGRTEVVAEQRDACWVQEVPGLPARTASGTLVGHADLTGTRHLTVAGVPVTPARLQLRAVLAVDGETVLFTASDEPTHTHLWRYEPGAGLERLTTGPGTHAGAIRAGTVVELTLDAGRPSVRAVVRRPGRTPVPVASLTLTPALTARPELLVLGPGELRAALFRPSWYEPGGGPLPVLADPYGGAGRQKVTADLNWAYLVSQWLADQGFAVLVADGRGTPGRGPDWERAVHGDLFGPPIEDQVTALHETARRYPELDLSRVGIRGWSYGGALALAAVLRRPDVFRAAVAGAGVTDQRLYNTHWRERFLGHPDEFPDRYEADSLVRAAPELTRPLLLIHGLADDNVHPASTLLMSRALLAAGRPHEVLLLPGVGHGAIGSAVTDSLLRHQADFFRRHLS